MALNINTTYPAQTNPPNANYPFGEPRNVTAPGAGDGTPWEQAILRDIYGFLQKILQDAPIVPSGSADTAVASDYMDGLDLLYLQRSELKSLGGDILTDSDRLIPGQRIGLLNNWISGTNVDTTAGSIRNQADTADLTLPTDMEKNITLTWAAGDTNGGLVDSFFPGGVLQGWYRKFLINTPAGVADIAFSQSPTAADVFTDLAVIAAGFSDSTLYKRVGWVYVSAGLVMPEFGNDPEEPSRHIWDLGFEDIDQVTLQTASREAFVLEHVPPNARAILNLYLNGNVAIRVLVTETQQTDTAPSTNIWTFRQAASSDSVSIRGEWRVDASRTIHARRTTGAMDNFQGFVDGWIDTLLVA
jgi:hypothetical protein